MKSVITVEHLSKRYRIGANPGHVSLRDTLAATVRAPLRRLQRRGETDNGIVWALNDVSFDVAAGEVIGIIGRNGAGKSTLLKILSRITKPTKGRVRLQGRVGSLLEVGTGFHSELTGRENVFLNGAILGMTRREIESKFEEIVAFAETERFLDTPVKHYSSGMTVRLAFAVAAHLDPEILIIDEVLAVGDIAFQKKCLGKMNEVATAGRTVLFVSHDLTAVNSLCERALLLHEGSIIREGPTREVSAFYLDAANKLYSPITWADLPADGGEDIRLHAASVTQRDAQTSAIDCREPFKICFEYENNVQTPGLRLFMLLRNAKGDIVFTTSDYDLPTPDVIHRRTGRFVSEITMPEGLLKTGSYHATIGADIKDVKVFLAESDVIDFEVYDSEDDMQSERHRRPGFVAPLLEWRVLESNSRPQS